MLCFSPPACSSARLNQVSIWIGDLPGEFAYSRKHSSLTETYFSIAGTSFEPSGSVDGSHRNSSFEWNKSKFLGISDHDGTFCSLLQSRRVSWPNSTWGDYVQLTENEQWQLLHFTVGQSSTQGFKFVIWLRVQQERKRITEMSL